MSSESLSLHIYTMRISALTHDERFAVTFAVRAEDWSEAPCEEYNVSDHPRVLTLRHSSGKLHVHGRTHHDGTTTYRLDVDLETALCLLDRATGTAVTH